MLPGFPPSPPQQVDPEELAKKIMGHVQEVAVQAKIQERKGAAHADVQQMQIKTQWGKGDPLYDFSKKLEAGVAAEVKLANPQDNYGAKLTAAMHDTVTNLSSGKMGYHEVTEAWQQSLDVVQNMAQMQYLQIMQEQAIGAAKAAIASDPLQAAINKKVDALSIEMREQIQAANSAIESYDKAAVKSEKLEREMREACAAAQTGFEGMLQAIKDAPKEVVQLCQAIVQMNAAATKDSGPSPVEVDEKKAADDDLASLAGMADVFAREEKGFVHTQLEAAVAVATAAGVDASIISELKGTPPKLPASVDIDVTGAVASKQTECDKKLAELAGLQSFETSKVLQNELQHLERVAASQRQNNASLLHVSLDQALRASFKSIYTPIDKEQEALERKLEKEDPDHFKAKGEDPIAPPFKTSIYKKEDLTSKDLLTGKPKFTLIDYQLDANSNSATACPIPMTGRASGFSFLDGGFERAWGAVFDQLAATHSKLTVSVDPSPDNKTSLLVMLDIAMTHKDKLVAIDPASMPALTQHWSMTQSKLEKILRKMQDHNDNVLAARANPYMEAAKTKDIDTLHTLTDKVDNWKKSVDDQLKDLDPIKGSDHYDLSCAATHLASAVDDMSQLMHKMPAGQLDSAARDNLAKKIDAAKDVIADVKTKVDAAPQEKLTDDEFGKMKSQAAEAVKVVTSAQTQTQQKDAKDALIIKPGSGP